MDVSPIAIYAFVFIGVIYGLRFLPRLTGVLLPLARIVLLLVVYGFVGLIGLCFIIGLCVAGYRLAGPLGLALPVIGLFMLVWDRISKTRHSRQQRTKRGFSQGRRTSGRFFSQDDQYHEAEFRRLWLSLLLQSRGQSWAGFVEQGYQATRIADNRLMAQAFFGLMLRHVQDMSLRESLRGEWRDVLRKYLKNGKPVFSWACLIELSHIIGSAAIRGSRTESRQWSSRWNRHSSGQNSRYRQGHRPSPSQNTARPWYMVLGVSEQASIEDIKKAYRRKIIASHPDRVAHLGDRQRDRAESASKEINEAFQYIKKYRGF